MANPLFDVRFESIGNGIPSIMIKEKCVLQKKVPAVIVQHGLFASKDRNLYVGLEFAKEGFLVVMPDAHLHGDRWERSLFLEYRKNPVSTKVEILIRTAEDLVSIIDYLTKRDDVESGRIGMAGVSMGGMLTFAGGIVDKRLKVLASIVGAGDFVTFQRESSLVEEMGVDKEALAQYRMSEMEHESIQRIDPVYNAEALPPRDLLMVTGAEDPIIPKKAVMATIRALKQAYAKHPDRFVFHEYPKVGHEATPEMFAEVVSFFKTKM